MRALAHGELFHNAREDMNEVPFLVVAFECGVKLPLAPLLRQFLSKIPLYLLQVSPTLWKNLLALSIMQHRAHTWTPRLEEL